MTKISLSEMSKMLGFSKTTISRVLNGKAEEYRISLETQELINSAYALINEDVKNTRNDAQQLRNNVDINIGLVVPFISNPFFANLAEAIISEAQENGLSVTTFDSQENPSMEQRIMKEVLSRNLSGLIIVPVTSRPVEIEMLQKHMPLILVDRYFKQSKIPYIACNNYEGGYIAMMHLLKANHRNILCIEGPQTSITTKERERGAKAAVRDFGKDCTLYLRGGEFSVRNGYLQTRLSKTLNPRPSAIFSMSSTILLGCIKAIREMGLSIPHDFSLITYDNHVYFDYLNPPISRIAQPLYEIGRTAVKIMKDCIVNNKPIKSQILLSPKVILRESIKEI